jgi:hypothetical protein
MTRDDILQRMADAGLKPPARGDFIFIHWDQIAMLLEYERERFASECIDLVAMYGGSVDLEAAIRSRVRP